MAKKKKTTITVDADDLDWGIRWAFYDACGGQHKRVGEVLERLMEEEVRRCFGPGSDRIIKECRLRHFVYEARKADASAELK